MHRVPAKMISACINGSSEKDQYMYQWCQREGSVHVSSASEKDQCMYLWFQREGSMHVSGSSEKDQCMYQWFQREGSLHVSVVPARRINASVCCYNMFRNCCDINELNTLTYIKRTGYRCLVF